MANTSRYVFLTSLLLFYFGQLLAQDYTVDVQTYGLEDGLLHRQVNTVFEDKNGFIWIGGEKGLQRFDGHDFKSWTKTDQSGLIFGISTIGQDDEGWLWIWNNNERHFVFLHPESEEILTEEERFGDSYPNFHGINVGHLPTNSKGQLFFSTTDGLIICYDGTNGFQSQQVDKELILRINFIDKQDHIWAQTPNVGFFKLNSKAEILNFYPLEKGHQANLTGGFGKEVLIHISDFPISGPTQEMFRVDSAGQLHFVKQTYNLRFAIDNHFWTKSSHLEWEVYDRTESNLLFTLKKENYSPVLSESSYPPYMDSHDNIWVYGNLGLSKIRFQPSRFQKYFTFDNENDKPFPNTTRGIWVQADSIFANFERSVTLRINRKNREDWQVFNHKKFARPLFRKQNGELWIGSRSSIDVFDQSGNFTRKITAEEEELMSTVWSFYEDKNETTWIGVSNNLFFKDKNKDFAQIYEPTQDSFEFKTNESTIQNMIPDKGTLVWFCSLSGLYHFDTQSKKIVNRYAADEDGANYLPADLFYYIHKDKDDVYWIGTSEGLIRWDKNANSHRLFTRREGLSNDVIYAIFEDDHNRLWMSSDYGIMSFDKETFDVKSYLEKDGISHHEFNRTSQFQTDDGAIYFGGLNGITAFHPDDFMVEEKHKLKMLISDYELFDGDEQKLVNKVGELRQTKVINFHSNDRFFRLKFVLPTFEGHAQILYAWKIEGVDSDWNYQKENSIQVGMLPYGSHNLRVKGQSGSGGWSPHELTIQVNVIKPFYLQLWFILLSFLTLLLGVYLFFRRRTRRLEEAQKLLEIEIEKATRQIQADKLVIESDKKLIEAQAEQLRALDQLKSRFFANVSHELKTPLSLMLGPINRLLKTEGRSEEDKTLLNFLQRSSIKLRNLVHEILDLSKLENNKMELKEEVVDFYSFLTERLSQFYSYGNSEDVKVKSHYPKNTSLQLLIDPQKVEKIIDNFLSNAIKFTPKGGSVNLLVEENENDLLITVSDTGRGIHSNDLPYVFDRFYQSKTADAPVEGGTGIGLSLCRELAELMGGKVWAESTLGAGSQFYFQFPKKTPSQKALPTLVRPPKREEKAISAEMLTPNIAIHKGAHILIAEDNADLRAFYEIILHQYQVTTKEHGRAALDHLENATVLPDLIISDLMMPVMDGMQFLTHLKSDDRWRNIPVIMLTAKSNRHVKIKALRIGIDDYLTKPFDEEELLVRIGNLLTHYQERKNFNPPTSTIAMPVISQEESEWLKALEAFIIKHIEDDRLTVKWVCYEFNMSNSTLLRQLKKLTGLSPSKYIQEHRLNHARQLLEIRQFKTIAQVAYSVGFKDSAAFSRSFKLRFGLSPSELVVQI